MCLSSGSSVSQFRVQCGTVQGAMWLSTGCDVAQYRVQYGSVEGCSVAQLRVQRGSAPDYTIKAISNFFEKICGDIGRCTTSVKWKKSSIRKVFIISFGHLWVVELPYR
jgi:hypothetical protein